MSKFECHITFDYEGDDEILQKIDKLVVDAGFKFSAIHGDPVLGNKTFAYGTKYGTDEASLVADMYELREAASCYDIDAVRIKVEEIKFDRRF